MDASCTVQRVTKASSDELLRKFAELDSDPPKRSSSPHVRGPIMRRKRSRRVISGLAAREATTNSIANTSCIATTRSYRRRKTAGNAAEWNSLLPTRTPLMFRKIEGETTGLRTLLVALEKAWRKTVEGTSKMLVEKHCNGHHVRLISTHDAV